MQFLFYILLRRFGYFLDVFQVVLDNVFGWLLVFTHFVHFIYSFGQFILARFFSHFHLFLGQLFTIIIVFEVMDYFLVLLDLFFMTYAVLLFFIIRVILKIFFAPRLAFCTYFMRSYFF